MNVKPVTEECVRQLQQRNAERAAFVVWALGEKYACHPANRVSKQPIQHVLGRAS
jgi:hypothetical protein